MRKIWQQRFISRGKGKTRRNLSLVNVTGTSSKFILIKILFNWRRETIKRFHWRGEHATVKQEYDPTGATRVKVPGAKWRVNRRRLYKNLLTKHPSILQKGNDVLRWIVTTLNNRLGNQRTWRIKLGQLTVGRENRNTNTELELRRWRYASIRRRQGRPGDVDSLLSNLWILWRRGAHGDIRVRRDFLIHYSCRISCSMNICYALWNWYMTVFLVRDAFTR